MMTEILFRGKRLDNGEWVEGNLFVSDTDGGTYILAGSRIVTIEWEVDPSTVGQYTGLKDKNGKRIFEGDVLKRYYDDLYADDAVIEHVVWFNNGWCANDVTNMTYEAYSIFKDDVLPYAEIIGNIHDNPEMGGFADEYKVHDECKDKVKKVIEKRKEKEHK